MLKFPYFTKIFKTVFLSFVSYFFVSCAKDTVELDPYDKYRILLNTPQHFQNFPNPDYNPNKVEAIVLGKKLFFDPILSGNNLISCASCHDPKLSFSDGVALSNVGVSGNKLHRNSPKLINLAWANNGLFWDGGATNLESLSVGPITHMDEMGQNILELIDELNTPDYIKLFNEAFPDEVQTGITTPKVLKALAQYMKILVSANSKYDRYILKRESFTDLEIEGLKIFDVKCENCHSRNNHLLTDNLFHNNGLKDNFPEDNERIEQGRYRVTFNPNDMGKFKTPTLRNWKYTAPYMHDGSLATLDDVLNHYKNNIKQSATLDVNLKAFSLTSQEISALKAFLETLNDPSFNSNKLFIP